MVIEKAAFAMAEGAFKAGQYLIEHPEELGAAERMAAEALGFTQKAAPRASEFAELANLAGSRLPADKAAITDSVESLARAITDDKPQLDANGKLQYYFAGSMGSNLIAKAGAFTELSEVLPSVERLRQIRIGDGGADALSALVRKVGDVDVVRMPDATIRIGKGGSWRNYAELDPSALAAFKSPGNGKVFMDPLEHKGLAPVSVQLGDREFFVPHPASAMSFKMVHNMEAFSHADPGKMTGDFDNLLNLASSVRPVDELVNIARQAVASYSESGTSLHLHDYDPNWTGSIKAFSDAVVDSHPDAKYVAELGSTRTWAIPLLKGLERLPNAEDKALFSAFVREHRESVEKWVVNENSLANRRAVAEEIVANRPDQLEHITGHSSAASLGVSPVDMVFDTLKTYPCVTSDVGKGLPGIAMQPSNTYLVQVLQKLNPHSVASDLAHIDALTSRGVSDFDLYRVMQSNTLSDLATRDSYFSAWRKVADEKPADDLRRFSWEVTKAIDPIWSKASVEDQIARARFLFDEAGVEMK